MKRIAFKPEMVRAIRADLKKETRRLMSPQPGKQWSSPPAHFSGGTFNRWGSPDTESIVPRYKVGEMVGVAEPWRTAPPWDHLSGKELASDSRFKKEFIHYESEPISEPEGRCVGRFRQARFLPDAFVRTKLKIVDVKAERVQEIGKDGRAAKSVLAEGVTDEQIEHWRKWLHPDDAPAHTFAVLWDSIHGKDAPWASNPWVWVYKFEALP